MNLAMKGLYTIAYGKKHAHQPKYIEVDKVLHVMCGWNQIVDREEEV